MDGWMNDNAEIGKPTLVTCKLAHVAQALHVCVISG